MTKTIRTKVVFRRGGGCLKHVIALENLHVDYSSGEKFRGPTLFVSDSLANGSDGLSDS